MVFLLRPHLVGAAKEANLFWRMLIHFMSLALGTNHLLQALRSDVMSLWGWSGFNPGILNMNLEVSIQRLENKDIAWAQLAARLSMNLKT